MEAFLISEFSVAIDFVFRFYFLRLITIWVHTSGAKDKRRSHVTRPSVDGLA